MISFWTATSIGGVPMTPDPNTSAKVLRYKWEACRDTNWWCIYYFLPRGGHTSAKVSRWKWEVYRDTFRKYRGQGSMWLSRFKTLQFPVFSGTNETHTSHETRDDKFEATLDHPSSLASRKRCDLKTRNRCDFHSAAQKNASDLSAIYLRFLLRCSGDFLRFLRQNLRFSTLRFENAVLFLRLRFFVTLSLLGVVGVYHCFRSHCNLSWTTINYCTWHGTQILSICEGYYFLWLCCC